MLDEKDLQAIAHLMNRQKEDLLQEMDLRMDKRFEQVDKRFEQIDKRFEQIDKRLDQMDKRFEEMDKHFERVDEHLAQIDERLDQMDKRFEQVDERFDQMEGSILQKVHAEMDERLGKFEEAIFRGVRVQIETTFMPEFRLLSERMDIFQEKLLPMEALEDLSDRQDVIEAVLKRHSHEIERLKKAQ